jgi:hypothetical protein
MEREIYKLKIRGILTIEDKQILVRALDGMIGLNFNPIAVITNEIEDYYFICKVKSIIKNLQMKMARVYIRVQKDSEPRLLEIEKIS